MKDNLPTGNPSMNPWWSPVKRSAAGWSTYMPTAAPWCRNTERTAAEDQIGVSVMECLPLLGAALCVAPRKTRLSGVRRACMGVREKAEIFRCLQPEHLGRILSLMCGDNAIRSHAIRRYEMGLKYAFKHLWFSINTVQSSIPWWKLFGLEMMVFHSFTVWFLFCRKPGTALHVCFLRTGVKRLIIFLLVVEIVLFCNRQWSDRNKKQEWMPSVFCFFPSDAWRPEWKQFGFVLCYSISVQIYCVPTDQMVHSISL